MNYTQTHDYLQQRWSALPAGLRSTSGDNNGDLCETVTEWRRHYGSAGCSNRELVREAAARNRIYLGAYRGRLIACACGNGDARRFGGRLHRISSGTTPGRRRELIEDRCDRYTMSTRNRSTSRILIPHTSTQVDVLEEPRATEAP